MQDCFSELQIPLAIPNLNQGDFSALTLTRQLQQVAAILDTVSTGFLERWLEKLGETERANWQASG